MKARLQCLEGRYLSEGAQGMVEYALIAAFICAIAATVFAAPGWMPDMIDGLYGAVQTRVEALAGN